MKKWQNKEELQNWLNDCFCVADFCRKLEVVPAGDNYRIVKDLIKENNLDISHFKGNEKYMVKQQGEKQDLSKILESGIYTNATKLKERLFKWGVKEQKCECCGNKEWLGVELPLEIHHIDGNHKNNHLENLQILCPNCHALTNNYRGRNIVNNKVNINPEDVKETIEKLKQKELEDKQQIQENKKYRREISSEKRPKTYKEPKYCIICGKELPYKNDKYCSLECSAKGQSKNDYNKDLILEQSKTVQSMIQLAKLYNITDNAMKKRLKSMGIFEECQKNFIPITKPILQYDLDDNFIREWSSAREASIELGITKCNILACCLNTRNTTHNYKFKYKE